jgi:hypothetical protein
VEFAGLGAVAFVHKYKQVALGAKVAGQVGFEVLEKLLGALGGGGFAAAAKFVHQGAQQPGGGGVELADQVGAAGGAVDGFVYPLKDAFDLLVQFGAIGDDEDAGVGLVFANPFGQPHHGQAFARALGVPDDAALALLDAGLGGFDAEVLVMAAGFLVPRSYTVKSWMSSSRRVCCIAAPGRCRGCRLRSPHRRWAGIYGVWGRFWGCSGGFLLSR